MLTLLQIGPWSRYLITMLPQTGQQPLCRFTIYSFLHFESDRYRMSISIATFAYVGVEIVAASALEVQWPRRQKTDLSATSTRSNDTLIGNTVKFSAIWISVLATFAYTLTSVLATLEIPWDNCQLPRLSWVTSSQCSTITSSTGPVSNTSNPVAGGKTSSVFVAIAAQSTIPHLSDIFNLFLVFTCLSCACTNLYVASRTLFGLTSRLDDGRSQAWYLRAIAYFGKTDRHSVPRRAMIFSAFAFWWVPFLQLRAGTSTSNLVGMVWSFNLCRNCYNLCSSVIVYSLLKS